MSRTQFASENYGDGLTKRVDLNVTEPGSAVIRKVVAGFGIRLTSTGADAGTGDVTVSVYDYLEDALRNGRLYDANAEINAGTTEANAFLIRNPSGSGKDMRLFKLVVCYLGTTTARSYFYMYSQPTVTTTGTGLTENPAIVGGSQAASVMQIFSAPTTSAQGVKRRSYSVQEANTVIDLNEFILKPNNDLLLRIKADGATKLLGLSLIWEEFVP